MEKVKGSLADTSLVLVFLLMFGVHDAAAQTYPQRPVRLIVNVGPGGGVDSIARIVAQQYASVWGQPFVVDNRPGAGGSIGAETVAKSAPDGYTLLVSSSSVVTNAAVRPQGYDPVRDLNPISRFVSSAYIMAVNPALNIATVQELIALAKLKPGSVSFASAGGTGSITHLGPELLSLLAGTSMLHVPYKGTGGAYSAVVSGEANWVIGNPVSIMPLIKASRLRAIAVTSANRLRWYPEIPTVAESGVTGYEVVGWFGMLGPARLESKIMNALQQEARKKLQSPEMVRQFDAEASEIVANSPQEFTTEVKVELDKWRDLVLKRGIKI